MQFSFPLHSRVKKKSELKTVNRKLRSDLLTLRHNKKQFNKKKHTRISGKYVEENCVISCVCLTEVIRTKVILLNRVELTSLTEIFGKKKNVIGRERLKKKNVKN